MKIYITRHGETIWNKEGKMQGWQNSALSQKGKENAKKLGKYLENVKFDKVYSSPLGRAYETTKLVIENQENIITKDYLKEMGFGIWEGMEKEKVDELYAKEKFLYWNRPHLYTPVKGGESFEKLFKRADAGLKDIIQSSAGCDNVLVVSHAVVIKAMFSIIKKLPLEEFWTPPFLENNCLSILEVGDKKTELIVEGDVTHL